jgi:2'-hydroxyisoflavone reductase
MKYHISRRKAVKTALAAGALAPLAGSTLFSCTSSSENQDHTAQDEHKLNILILGGTSFLGPHQVAYALKQGHKVSTFTRGKTKPSIHGELFDQVEQLIGDRENDLSALENREWDVVIDNSGRKVEWTKATAELLKDKVGMYLYTSSTGVYYPYLTEDIKEQKRVFLEVPEDAKEDEKMEYGYGVMKANSEIAARTAFGKNRTIVVRPTYMIGPADKTNRFIHWPLRLAKGGEVLIPGKSDDPVQYADVRDVAEFMIRLAEQKASGTYNAVGPSNAVTISDFAAKALNAFDVDSNPVMVDDYEFLFENGIYYLVPWIPVEGNNWASARVSNEKAIQAGLVFRDLKTSIRDTYEWWQTLPKETREAYESDENILLNREEEVLAKWKQLA